MLSCTSIITSPYFSLQTKKGRVLILQIFQTMATEIIRGIKVALIQLRVTKDKDLNIKNALNFVKTAKNNSALLAILPECFNSPYGTTYFPEYAESIPDGVTCQALSQSAKSNGIYLIGGSIPERRGSKLYNTCTVWNPEGQLVAKHSKLHLFDIDIPGKICFKESDVLSPGENITTFNIAQWKIGIGICYDIRFTELASLYRKMGCDMLVYPGAFNMTTGPLHWELLARGRANDNQLYVAVVSPARDENSNYVAWGHSTVADPMGRLVATTGVDETIIYADLDAEVIEGTRAQIPISKQTRTDIYQEVKSNL